MISQSRPIQTKHYAADNGHEIVQFNIHLESMGLNLVLEKQFKVVNESFKFLSSRKERRHPSLQ